MVEQSHSRRKPGSTSRALSLRRGNNIAEARLWNELKDRKLGSYKFVRQLPIGPYFADFANREQRLVVEIDGSQHAGNRRDKKRDEFMRERGYSVLRIWNGDVLSAIGPVCETILAVLNDRLTQDTVAVDLKYVQAVRRIGE